jgi:aspartyl protease family protein
MRHRHNVLTDAAGVRGRERFAAAQRQLMAEGVDVDPGRRAAAFAAAAQAAVEGTRRFEIAHMEREVEHALHPGLRWRNSWHRSAMSAELPRTFKVVTVWLLLGISVFFGVQWWQHRQAQTRFHVAGSTIELRRGSDGHYHWPGRINGRSVDFLIDTGATGTAIPASLVRELRLEPIGEVRSSTANGTITGKLVRVELELRGGVRADRLRVVALPGLADRPLLGMDVLGRLRWQQRDGVLRIEAGGAR